MRRLSLGAMLGVLSIAFVTFAVVIMGVAARGVLRKLAAEDARARVSLGAASAAESLHKAGADLTVAASLLAERPTLARLLAANDVPSLRPYLGRFTATGGLTACVVRRGGRLVAGSGATLAWEQLGSPSGAVPVMVVNDGGGLLLLARADVPSLAGA